MLKDIMTAREIYDHIVENLLIQNKQSGNYKDDDESFICLYRATDGCKCAAGWIMEDHEYHSLFEGETIDAVITSDLCPKSLKDRVEEHITLLCYLQNVHDTTENTSLWKEKFEVVAEKFRLNIKGQ